MKSFLKKKISRRWPWCCLLFFVIGCGAKMPEDGSPPPAKDSVAEEQKITAGLDSISLYEKLVKQGDLVVRTGMDFTSETMRHLCEKDKTYSHCGIASIEHDSIFVYHSIGGEWNPNQKLRRDPFQFFCNPFENRGFGIFRYNLSPGENAQLKNIVQKFYARGIMFDMQFDLASDDRLYCTEFVYKAVKEATDNRIAFSTTLLNHMEFVAPDNLFKTAGCIEIKRVRFAR